MGENNLQFYHSYFSQHSYLFYLNILYSTIYAGVVTQLNKTITDKNEKRKQKKGKILHNGLQVIVPLISPQSPSCENMYTDLFECNAFTINPLVSQTIKETELSHISWPFV